MGIIADARLDRINQQGGIIELIAMTNAIGDSLWRERFSALLVGLFAGLAALIAAVGLYAVVSHTVGRRTQEIASRFQRNLAASRQLDLSSAPESDDVLVTLRRVPHSLTQLRDVRANCRPSLPESTPCED